MKRTRAADRCAARRSLRFVSASSSFGAAPRNSRDALGTRMLMNNCHAGYAQRNAKELAELLRTR